MNTVSNLLCLSPLVPYSVDSRVDSERVRMSVVEEQERKRKGRRVTQRKRRKG